MLRDALQPERLGLRGAPQIIIVAVCTIPCDYSMIRMQFLNDATDDIKAAERITPGLFMPANPAAAWLTRDRENYALNRI